MKTADEESYAASLLKPNSKMNELIGLIFIIPDWSLRNQLSSSLSSSSSSLSSSPSNNWIGKELISQRDKSIGPNVSVFYKQDGGLVITRGEGVHMV